MLGTYQSTAIKGFRCGISSFILKAGSTVEVRQHDRQHRKILIDFGGRDIDWFPENELKWFEKVN